MAVGPGRPRVIFALTLALQSAQAVRQSIDAQGSGPGRGRGQQLRQQGQLLRVPSSATAVASAGRGAPCACEAYSASWRYAQKRPPTCLFIDLGAADGETFRAFMHQSNKWAFNYSTGPFQHKDCYAYLMEANPKFGQQLEQFRTDHVYPMTTTAAYMCDKPKERFYLDVKGPGGWGSSLDHDHEAVSADTSKQAVDVQLYNLMRLLQENALPEDNVVVKMDIEGAEYDILPCLADSPAATLIDTLYLEDHCPGDWWCPTTGQAGNSKQVFAAALQKLKQRGVAIPPGYWSPM